MCCSESASGIRRPYSQRNRFAVRNQPGGATHRYEFTTRRTIDGLGPMSDDGEADPEAWVDRHGDGLYRYALLRLRSPELASDVVQETFLEALRARGSFAARSS